MPLDYHFWFPFGTVVGIAFVYAVDGASCALAMYRVRVFRHLADEYERLGDEARDAAKARVDSLPRSIR